MAKKETPGSISDKDFEALPKALQEKIRALDAAQNPEFQKQSEPEPAPAAPKPKAPRQKRTDTPDTSPSVSSGNGLTPTPKAPTPPKDVGKPFTAPEPKQRGAGDVFFDNLKANVVSKNKSSSIGPVNPTSGDVIKEGAKQAFKNLGNKAFDTAFPSLSKVMSNSGGGGGGGAETSARESTDSRQANNSIANQISVSNQILNNIVATQTTTNMLLNELIKTIQKTGAGGQGGSGGSILGDAAGAVLDHLGGGGGKGAPKASPAGVQPKTSMLGKAGNLVKGAGNLLWKAKGGLGAILGGAALDYAGDKFTEAGHEKVGASLGVGSSALAGAGMGAAFGPIGAGIGGALGAGVGLYQNWDKLFGNSTTMSEKKDEMRIGGEPWKKGEELNAKQLMAVKLQISMDPTGSKINPDVLEQFMKQIGRGASGPSASADIKDAQQVSSGGSGSPGASDDIKDAQKTSAPSASASGASPAAASSSSSAAGGSAAGASTPYSGPGVSATGSAKEAIEYFTGKGWTKAQAIGITANLEVESNFKTNAVGDGGKAYGIAQWHPDRQAEFQKKYNKDIRQASFQEQMDFVNHEMTQGSERIAGTRLKQAKSASEAAAIVDQFYERSDGKARQNRMNIASKYEKAEGTDASKTESQSSEAQYDAMGNVTVPAAGAPSGGSGPAISSAPGAAPAGGGGSSSSQGGSTPASPGGGGSGASSGADASKVEGKDIGNVPPGDIVAAGKALQSMGINISENPAFGGVQKGAHARGSAHYEGKAIDLNGPSGMIEANDPVWGPKFDQVAKQMRQAGYRVMWRSAGHFNHLHAQMDGGKATGMGTPGQNSAAGTTASLTPNEAAAIQKASVSKGASLSKASSNDVMDQRTAKTSIVATQQSAPIPPRRPSAEPKFGPDNVGNLEPVDARTRFKELFGMHS